MIHNWPRGSSISENLTTARLKTPFIASAFTAVLVYLSYRFVDGAVARSVLQVVTGHQGGSTSGMPELPDLLLPAVITVTIAGWVARFVLPHDSSWARLRGCLAMLGIVAPLSYAAKEVLKLVFGRIRTRDWLLHPQLDGFHWFHGSGIFDGFPSGHMTVFVALAAVVWRFYPRYGPLLGVLLAALAAALVLLDYHFVSDVIAGSYFGILAYWLASRSFVRTYRT